MKATSEYMHTHGSSALNMHHKRAQIVRYGEGCNVTASAMRWYQPNMRRCCCEVGMGLACTTRDRPCQEHTSSSHARHANTEQEFGRPTHPRYAAADHRTGQLHHRKAARPLCTTTAVFFSIYYFLKSVFTLNLSIKEFIRSKCEFHIF